MMSSFAKYPLLIVVVVVVVVLFSMQELEGCLEKERLGLLELKSFFLNGSSGHGYLSSWVDEKDADCCVWERVKCNHNTTHVMDLLLGEVWPSPWVEDMNFSFIRPFKQLVRLDLSNNYFVDLVDIEGLCEMKNLQELDLSMNGISGHFPECLSQLKDLRVLDLSSNYLSGNVPSFINSLKSLEYISLFDNMFDGILSFSSLTNHSKLEVFSLSTTTNNLHVETEDPSWLPTFQLKVLQLRNCNLNSKRNGSIPSFLLHQHELRIIDLSHNKLEGEFPSWLLQNNSKLETFYVKNNSFTGTLQLPTFKHGLLDLQVSDNKIGGELPENIGDIFLTLFYVNLSKNSFEGILPSSMGEMQTIEILDLSYNNFSGELTTHLLSNWTSLLLLRLSHNSFHGPVNPMLSKLTSLIWLYLSYNSFSGEIEGGVSNKSRLYTLDISNNMIYGRIPRGISNFTKLKILLLSKNQLQGHIPYEFCNLSNLYHLDLSKNNLSGPMPSCFNHISSLEFLYLQKNALDGYMPYLSAVTRLLVLDLKDNNFFGNIPHWINRLSELRVLLLAGNKLTGTIPIQMSQLKHLKIIDLSHNYLTGAIPSFLNNTSIHRYDNSAWDVYLSYQTFTFIPNNTFHTFYHSSLSLNQIVGENYEISYEQLEVEFRTKSYYLSYKGKGIDMMIGLDLSSNELSGSIPPEIGELREIFALNLSHNQLSGSIPVSFSNLINIEGLDLSYNNLSGAIPPNMTELYSLAIFNVSYNNLSGAVPSTWQFANFDENNYIGNSYLCGLVLNRSCTRTIESPPPSANKLAENETLIDMWSFYWGFIASFITVVIGLAAILWINSHWSRAWFRFVDLCLFFCFSRCLKNVFH